MTGALLCRPSKCLQWEMLRGGEQCLALAVDSGGGVTKYAMCDEACNGDQRTACGRRRGVRAFCSAERMEIYG